MLFFVMRAMGEILLSNLNYKSFSDFAGDLLGPWASFFTGWSYWAFWVVTGVADIVAISGYVNVLAPGTPLWIPALLTPVVLILLNLPSVRPSARPSSGSPWSRCSPSSPSLSPAL
jgi:D-serine/D-alanine/glycine transporter